MEYPHLQDLYEQYKDRGFVILSVDTTNRPELAREFTSSVGATFPVMLDTTDIADRLFEVQAVPTNIMIDREGRMFFRSLGFSPGKEKTLAAEIEYLLGTTS